MPQPLPKPGKENVSPVALQTFLSLLAEREKVGIATYGTTLQTFNSRDPLMDAIEELVDGFQYLVQAMMEHKALEKQREAAETHTLTACEHCGKGVRPSYAILGLCQTCATEELSSWREGHSRELSGH